MGDKSVVGVGPGFLKTYCPGPLFIVLSEREIFETSPKVHYYHVANLVGDTLPRV